MRISGKKKLMTEIFDDIRSIYEFAAPCAELVNEIEFFSETSEEATKKIIGNSRFDVKMFPSWTPTIWINLGSAYQVELNDKELCVPATKNILVIRDAVTRRINEPSDHIFTVKFFPGGLKSILGIDQTRMKSSVIDVSDILPSKLITQIRSAPGFEKRKQLVESYFRVQKNSGKPELHYLDIMQEAIDYFLHSGMQPNVSQVAERNFVSSKTITRYFTNTIGTSPKNYFMSLRSRTALSSWVKNKKEFDPSLFGYYDMSHFYRDAKKFTGNRLRHP
jgi:AraC-like DNA-binding protein